MKQLLTKGFTLIELMIVIAIIAILASIAIPSYQSYTARAQLSEAFVFLDHAKTAVSSYIQSGGDLASISNSRIGLDNDTSGQYVNNITVTHDASTPPNAVITATLKSTTAAAESATDKTIVMTQNGHTWNCASNVNPKYLPTTCLD